MFSRLADVLVPTVGRLTVTVDAGSAVVPGSIIAANHTSLADPAVVLAALHRLGVQPVAMGAAGLWRIPLLGRALTREGHIPVYRGDPRAADALDLAADALAEGRTVLIYAEGGIRSARTPPKPRPNRSAAVWPGSPSAPARPSCRSARPGHAESPPATRPSN